MKNKKVGIIVCVMLAASLSLTGCLEWFQDETDVDVPPDPNLALILNDRVAQKILAPNNVLDTATFYFKDCNYQTIQLTVEVDTGLQYPSGGQVLDVKSYQVGGVGTDQSLTFANFGSGYQAGQTYWFILERFYGDPLEVSYASEEYIDGIATKNDGSTWELLDRDIAFNMQWSDEEPDPGSDLIKTFSCDPNEDADLHLITGECMSPMDNNHVYYLGGTYILQRIVGEAEIYSSGAGSGSILFFMSNFENPQFGDMDWIRVHGPYNVRHSFDNNVYPTNQVYKTKGQYLIISSGGSRSMAFSEGTIYLSEVEE